MSAELLNLLQHETQIVHTKNGHGVRRKDTLRTRRYGQHKARRRRQIEPTSATEQPDAEQSTRRTLAQPSGISVGERDTLASLLRIKLSRRTTCVDELHYLVILSTQRCVDLKEWSGATGGPPAEVVLRIHPAETTASVNISSLSDSYDGSGVVVRAEEALIVAFVLLLWVAAIALFFNRWGKIRMLEPYQPKFQQQHRQSCALAEASVTLPPHVSVHRKPPAAHRASLSRGCVSYDCGAAFPAYQPCAYLSHRPRQNSVFVGSMGGMALIPESPPRRSRSAADLPALAPPSEPPQATPRSSRAASLHSAVDLRLYVPSPRASRAASLHSSVDMPAGSVQVHVRGSGGNLNKPRSPRRLTITNV